MKHGKFILSAAALFVTAVNVLSFRVAHKNGQSNVFVRTGSGGCKLTTCFVNDGGPGSCSCRTLPNKVRQAVGSGWTTANCVNNQVLCTHTN